MKQEQLPENGTERKKKAECLLRIVPGDVTLGVHTKEAHYLFSYQAGGPESFSSDGVEWLYRAPSPAYWRASTDNDRGAGFPYRSAMWLGADLFPRCTDVKVRIDGTERSLCAPENNKAGGEETASEVSIVYTYETATVPAAKTSVCYTVEADGSILVKVHYYGRDGLPELPCMGLRFLMPTAAAGFSYDGLSGETYPDRRMGGVPGRYDVEGLPVTPYLVPQECGMHVETKRLCVWRTGEPNWELTKAQKKTSAEGYAGLCIEAEEGSTFAFSCLPYTAAELENALHQEELPPVRRTVLCIYGAVRGVGGIDSWGTDVTEPYRISAKKDICFAFQLKLLRRVRPSEYKNVGDI